MANDTMISPNSFKSSIFRPLSSSQTEASRFISLDKIAIPVASIRPENMRASFVISYFVDGDTCSSRIDAVYMLKMLILMNSAYRRQTPNLMYGASDRPW